MTGAMTLGRISTNMIRIGRTPITLAAWMYSRSRIENTWPRTMRATDAQLKKPMTRMVTVRLGPVIDTSAIASRMNGRDRTTSMILARTESIHPPKKPAMRPTTAPVTTVSPVATTPTRSEIRAPYAIRTRMSRPRSSVPSQNL